MAGEWAEVVQRCLLWAWTQMWVPQTESVAVCGGCLSIGAYVSERSKVTKKASLDKAYHPTDQSGCQEVFLCLGHTSCELVIVDR